MFYRIAFRFQIKRNIFVPSGLGRVKTLPYKNPLQQPDKLQFELRFLSGATIGCRPLPTIYPGMYVVIYPCGGYDILYYNIN